MRNQEVHHECGKAMSAKQVREALEDVDDDAPVFFVCDYGDYSTKQALPVTEVVDAERKHLYESAYSQSGVAMREEDRDETDEDENGEPDEDAGKPICIFMS